MKILTLVSRLKEEKGKGKKRGLRARAYGKNSRQLFLGSFFLSSSMQSNLFSHYFPLLQKKHMSKNSEIVDA